MSLTDALPYAPLVAICVGLIGLLVAVRAGFIRRDFWKAKLRLTIGFSQHSEWKKEIPWRLRRKPLSALFLFVPESQKEHFILPLAMTISNGTFKSVKDVVVELVYPERFLVTNAELKSAADKSYNTLRRENIDVTRIESDYHMMGEFLEKRQVYIAGDIVKIRYQIEAMRPSEGIVVGEPIKIRLPSIEQSNPGIGGAAYARIAQEIRQIAGVLDHCVVSYVALAENYLGKQQHISVSIVKEPTVRLTQSAQEERFKQLIQKYTLAHWFGRFPRSGIYYVPPFPLNLLFGKQKSSVEMAEVIHMHEERRVARVKKRGRKLSATIVSHLDLLGSSVAYTSINLPMYDYYSLPDNVSTPEEALAHIGAEYATLQPTKIKNMILGWIDIANAECRKLMSAAVSRIKNAVSRIKNIVILIKRE